MKYSTITWEVDSDGIAVITLNRPEKLNAFTQTMGEELIHAFTEQARKDSVSAVIVTGQGETFCAGMQLSSTIENENVFGIDETLPYVPEHFFEHYDEPPYEDGLRDLGGKLALAIHSLPKPVIAAINGAAVGIGATMTLAMDMRLASDTAKIGFVFGQLGIVPEACSTWFLPRLVGIQQALEWIFSAQLFNANTALQAGLLRSVHNHHDLLPTALRLAKSFVNNRSAQAIGLSKQLVYRNTATEDPLSAHLSESLAMRHTSAGDGKEGVSAFLEKRRPFFTSQASQLPNIFD